MKLEWHSGCGWFGFIRLWIYSPSRRGLRFAADFNFGRARGRRRVNVNDQLLTAAW